VAEQRVVRREGFLERRTCSTPQRPSDLSFDFATRNELHQDLVTGHETKGVIQTKAAPRYIADCGALKAAVAVHKYMPFAAETLKPPAVVTARRLCINRSDRLHGHRLQASRRVRL
jgi:hypothetical protein